MFSHVPTCLVVAGMRLVRRLRCVAFASVSVPCRVLTVLLPQTYTSNAVWQSRHPQSAGSRSVVSSGRPSVGCVRAVRSDHDHQAERLPAQQLVAHHTSLRYFNELNSRVGCFTSVRCSGSYNKTGLTLFAWVMPFDCPGCSAQTILSSADASSGGKRQLSWQAVSMTSLVRRRQHQLRVAADVGGRAAVLRARFRR